MVLHKLLGLFANKRICDSPDNDRLHKEGKKAYSVDEVNRYNLSLICYT